MPELAKGWFSSVVLVASFTVATENKLWLIRYFANITDDEDSNMSFMFRIKTSSMYSSEKCLISVHVKKKLNKIFLATKFCWLVKVTWNWGIQKELKES